MLTSWLLMRLLLVALLQLPAESESDGLDDGLQAQAAPPPPLAMRRQLALDPSLAQLQSDFHRRRQPARTPRSAHHHTAATR